MPERALHAGETVSKVRSSPPPPLLMRLINPVVRRFLTTRLLGGHIEALMLVEFTGRRTGRVIRLPMARHLIEGDVCAFTGRPWRLNFTGGAPVIVTHRGRARQGHASLLAATSEQVGAALRTALDNGSSPFVLGLKIPRGDVPTVADLARVQTSLIRFDLEPVGRSAS
jgi:hypothetical protein